jgi:D-serine deaminase-like pyridoxal phosphate-dependent protein
MDNKVPVHKKWVPEYADFGQYPKPIIDHAFARERCLKAFKGLNSYGLVTVPIVKSVKCMITFDPMVKLPLESVPPALP